MADRTTRPSRAGETPPLRGWRAVAMGVFSVLCAVVGVVALALLPGAYAESSAIADAPVCEPTPTAPQQDPTCLAEVGGAVDDVRRSSGRGARSPDWHFAPDDPAFPAAWVDFRGTSDEDDWSAAQRHLFAGEPVTARYWGAEPVAFVTPEGPLRTSSGRDGAWTAMLWVGLGGLALGGMQPATAYLRRRATPGVPLGTRLRATLVGATPLWLLFGVGAAIFPERVSTQVVAAATVLLAGLALTAAGAVWSARRESRAPR
ncbi:hypothetical protein [Nocardioides sp. Arc9.136]|uniref:hypothetical protein n=1 Tax=Nocardioides sp. Arc9.136 TaxID=2996826 RepID=UPI0026671598|nr:hypothetical protein [Nocardioides sp. Arc9.136]WKN47445.1 hypothetical protein OSR43_15565 [Nocardioides sp. Arc9.136]